MTKRSVLIVAEEIFVKLGKPLHYKELTKMLLDQCDLTGKTPHESVRSLLATSPKFKRIAEGTYALASWREYQTARFAKDIAYDILHKKGKPISLVLLGEKILEERKFIGGPAMVARGVLNTDKRFYFDQKLGVIGLVEWKKA